MHDVRVRVREHLHLDVPRVLQVPLDVHGGVGEILLALSRGRLERAGGVSGLADDLHPLPAAAGGCLDDQGVAQLRAEGDDLLRRANRLDGARDDRDAGGAHRGAGGGLRAHQLDRGRGRADPDEPRLLDEPGKPSVLGEEPVARMNRLGSRPAGRVDDAVAAQVALGRRAGPDAIRLVGRAHVRGPPVGVRIDGDAADSELAERAEDADRDLPAVRDEHLRERRHARRILPQP